MVTLFIRNKPDLWKDGRCCKRRYSVIQVNPDSRKSAGQMSGSRGREDVQNGMGNFIHLRVHVPGLSEKLKQHIEKPYEVWERPPNIGEFPPKKPAIRLPRSYYLDYQSLPDWAKIQMEYGGECTLPPHIAILVIKRCENDEPDYDLFRRITA